MPDWVQEFKPYCRVERPFVRNGTVLRSVPFERSTLDGLTFAEQLDGKTVPLSFPEAQKRSDVARTSRVELSSAIVITPDCDIFQHNVNALIVVQVLSVSEFTLLNNLTEGKLTGFQGDVQKGKSENPGSFGRKGLVLLPGDPDLTFPDSIALLNMHSTLPVRFPAGNSKGCEVVPASIGGQDNIWFHVAHAGFRACLVNEFARQLLRVGLEDAAT